MCDKPPFPVYAVVLFSLSVCTYRLLISVVAFFSPWEYLVTEFQCCKIRRTHKICVCGHKHGIAHFFPVAWLMRAAYLICAHILQIQLTYQSLIVWPYHVCIVLDIHLVCSLKNVIVLKVKHLFVPNNLSVLEFVLPNKQKYQCTF